MNLCNYLIAEHNTFTLQLDQLFTIDRRLIVQGLPVSVHRYAASGRKVPRLHAVSVAVTIHICIYLYLRLYVCICTSEHVLSH